MDHTYTHDGGVECVSETCWLRRMDRAERAGDGRVPQRMHTLTVNDPIDSYPDV